MKKNPIQCYLIIMSILIFSCSKEKNINEVSIIETDNKEPLSKEMINAKIDEIFSESSTKDKIFNWEEASTYLLWSASQQGQKVITIGFGTNANDFIRQTSTHNLVIESEILSLIEKLENKKPSDFLIESDKNLNILDVIIEKQETIAALRNYKYLRYIEPGDYRYFEAKNNNNKISATNSSSGCGYESDNLNPNDYQTVSPNTKVPWSFYEHKINKAWDYSTGNGITIGIVDTGISPEQSALNNNFNLFPSDGRFVEKYGTYVDSFWPWVNKTDGPFDKCGHGTSMISVATAPRNNAGSPVGIAYNSSVISYRAASDVLLDGYHEHNGVKNAFIALANDQRVKIISMSMGNIFSVGKISDGIRYAHQKGKLIFCAAGTSFSFTSFVGVIFPASMNEVVAVTGVKEGSVLQKCNECHAGNKVEFTIIMQRIQNDNTVPVNCYYNNLFNYVGGSSIATASSAGIAALVWSKNPNWTRDQVINKMRQSASLFPNRNSQFGYGNLDALKAVSN